MTPIYELDLGYYKKMFAYLNKQADPKSTLTDNFIEGITDKLFRLIPEIYNDREPHSKAFAVSLVFEEYGLAIDTQTYLLEELRMLKDNIASCRWDPRCKIKMVESQNGAWHKLQFHMDLEATALSFADDNHKEETTSSEINEFPDLAAIAKYDREAFN